METFQRPVLRATQAKVPDPLAEVETLLDRASGVLEGQFDDEPNQRAYEMLALWGALSRVQDKLLSRADKDKVQRDLDVQIRQHGKHLAPEAIEILNPAAWLKSAKALTDLMVQEPIPAEQAVGSACDLLQDLDEADLVLAAAEELDAGDPALAKQLRECLNWAIACPDVFLPGAVFIQAMAATFKAALENDPSPIAATCDKYVFLLDALEHAEADMRMESDRKFDPKDLKRFLKEKWETSWLPMPQERVLAAAKGSRPPGVSVLYWDEPGSRRYARLITMSAQSASNENESLVVKFVLKSEKPCTALAGRRITLAGITSKIRKDGTARFRLDDLRYCRTSPPELIVGTKKWRPRTVS